MTDGSFFWFDYETFGRHPAFDRAAQFAGVRTDTQLRPIGEPLLIYCKPADDYLPEPEACLITGITPQQCLAEGVPEVEFISQIREAMTKPGTCNVGYNNIRFDDEFTRHLLFRNFFDPYEHEWRNNNSRWDLLDIVRATRALRPEGIEWPFNEDGSINNKLDTLAPLNGISHENAHDALSDVYATIALAKLIRERKPRLFDYLFNHRDKHSVNDLLNLKERKPLVHVSGMIHSQYLHTALIFPIIRHPSNQNGILVYDLRFNPDQFLELEPEELALRLFSPAEELPDDMTRVPVKTVHTNRCPVLAPLNTLDEAAQKRTQISVTDALKHANLLRDHRSFAGKLSQAFEEQTFPEVLDLDGSLYSGGFFTASDKRAFERIHNTSKDKLGSLDLFYDDMRIPDLLFRYRARNFPETLSEEETQLWARERMELLGLTNTSPNSTLLTHYLSRLDNLKTCMVTRLHTG